MAAHRKIVEAGFPPIRKAAAEAGLELVEIWVESPASMQPPLTRCGGMAWKPS